MKLELLEKCTICPHNCGINRTNNQIGRCKSKDTVKIALYSIHNFEEPCISGKKGSGTVFFSNCNMNCVFCQNYEISQQGKGKEITIEDFKYSDNELAKRLSKVDNYFEIATQALTEMYKQTGKAVFDDRGIMQKGMIIRHLVLPNHILNSRRVLKWINENMHDVYVSVMAQYFPTYKAKDIEDINRKLTKEEYEQIENYLYRLDL